MKITIYTITDCPFSKSEKEYLTSKTLQFEEKNLEQNKDFLQEMLAVSDNFAGVPFTVIVKDDGTESKLKGFTKEEFDSILSVGAPTVQTTTQAAAVSEPQEPALPSSQDTTKTDLPFTASGVPQAEAIPSQSQSTTTPPMANSLGSDRPIMSPTLPTNNGQPTNATTGVVDSSSVSTNAASDPQKALDGVLNQLASQGTGTSGVTLTGATPPPTQTPQSPITPVDDTPISSSMPGANASAGAPATSTSVMASDTVDQVVSTDTTTPPSIPDFKGKS